ncbi:TetR/AcrR family transcriptional regulator [Streptomyces caatingaensis]|uniref:TetR family transcriptional regulator n=1 Tax=Streptomyces caatingaensis TaxID=1678637 RepID=A0A0K9XHM9_9ACTN|nr:TetR/AcrR family transcriptional regulator [Streptomyces caatingaensis]KNB52576.1 TetR family transcriptional regulator [Streptomyces caatingaensis]
MGARSSKRKQEAPAGRTFIEEARRAQIVAAAIEVIAEFGYAKATFGRIARRAGLSSTGVISYHFAGKDDLMREVVAEVMRVADGYMRPRVEAETTSSGRLRAFIESNLALLEEFPRHLPAMVEVLSNVAGRCQGEPAREFAEAMEKATAAQIEGVRHAQKAGDFREFDAETMVIAIRGAIDALVVRAARDPGFDAAVRGRELAEIFDRATRRTP